MYEGLRLTELHEEWAWKSFMRGFEEEVANLDAEIHARVAAQEIERPYLYRSPGVFCGYQFPLLFGIPDAKRVYPAKRRGLPSPLTIRNMAGEAVHAPALESFLRKRLAGREYADEDAAFPFDRWTNHARHAVPVEGCHLCREGSCSLRP